MSNTIYDSVHRTMLNDCTPLIIPVINEVFNEHYKLNEKIQVYPNENVITSPEGDMYTRITDSNAVIYLRHNSNTPDVLNLIIQAESESIIKKIPTIKIQRYTDEIFDKRLYFFLPFHIFIYEKELSVYNVDKKRREIINREYEEIVNKLIDLEKQGKLDKYTVHCIVNSMKQVLEKLAYKYTSVVREGVEAMGGVLLDYPGSKEFRKARSEGRREGYSEGQNELIRAVELLRQGKNDDEIISSGIARDTLKLAYAIK